MKYSFIIPVYGCEKYLRSCVESLIHQTLQKDYEIILVDDGSKDQSGEIADLLAQEYSCVQTFHKENGGAASARNLGIQNSKGKYLLFIDGDDTVDQNLLETIDSIIVREPDSLFIYGMSFDYYQKGQIKRNEILSCKHEGKYLKEELLENYSSFFNDNALSSACNKVFFGEIVRNINLSFKEGMTLYEDYDFVLRYLKYVDSIYCINQPFYHYRHDLENMHIHARVADIEKLKCNLSLLNQAILELSKDKRIIGSTIHLNMSLLDQHLMGIQYTVKELNKVLPDFVDDNSFKRMLMIDEEFKESVLLKRIQNKQFVQIYVDIRKRKVISYVKKHIKKLLRK